MRLLLCLKIGVFGQSGGGQAFDNPVEEITWERSRKADRDALISYEVKVEELNNISYQEDIVSYIENDIITCMNKIKGWIYLKNKNLEAVNLYFYVEILKSEVNKGLIIPLNIRKLKEDMSEDDKLKYGFESYLPAEIIHNQNDIKEIGLLVKCDTVWGRKEIYKKY